jgi:hypothetical protein
VILIFFEVVSGLIEDTSTKNPPKMKRIMLNCSMGNNVLDAAVM